MASTYLNEPPPTPNVSEADAPTPKPPEQPNVNSTVTIDPSSLKENSLSLSVVQYSIRVSRSMDKKINTDNSLIQDVLRNVRFSAFYRTFYVFMFALNILTLALTFVWVHNPPEWLWALEVVLTIFFALEVTFRMGIEGKNFWCGSWNMADVVVLLLCIVSLVYDSLWSDRDEHIDPVQDAFLVVRYSARFLRLLLYLYMQRRLRNAHAVDLGTSLSKLPPIVIELQEVPTTPHLAQPSSPAIAIMSDVLPAVEVASTSTDESESPQISGLVIQIDLPHEDTESHASPVARLQTPTVCSSAHSEAPTATAPNSPLPMLLYTPAPPPVDDLWEISPNLDIFLNPNAPPPLSPQRKTSSKRCL